ncbi:SUKH-4 family immunity protein [Actinoplanes philippinensis]|uniref:SUKH-4 family immunity protein n=1 Tax=Actinoplanes philippinensis TaxID=35752 RepID=UPI0033E9D25B
MPLVRNQDLALWARDIVRLETPVIARWRVPAETRSLLVGVGLPALDTRFVPDPQGVHEPRLGGMYVIGRELQLANHIHLPECAECGYFGLREDSGEVIYRWRGEVDHASFVNSSLRHFLYFIHRQGAATSRYSDLPDDKMIPLYERVVSRLKAWDSVALNHESSFWRARFARLWG